MEKNNSSEGMDLPWGSEWSKKFVTNVGLITSSDGAEDNIMSSEWTHHVSYSPGIIAVCIKKTNTTHDNVLKTKEFGVSLASQDQNILAYVAGTNSGKDLNKISVLKELGFKFFKAEKINALLVEGASLHLECKVWKSIELPERTIFLGLVVERHSVPDKTSLIYHSNKFWKFGQEIEKPSEQEMKKINEAVEKNKK